MGWFVMMGRMPDAEDFDELADPADRREELAEPRRYEEEREDKRRRRDAASRRVVGCVVAVALAFLLYDAAGGLSRAISGDEPWGTHAVMAGLSVLGLAGLLALGVRALRRR